MEEHAAKKAIDEQDATKKAKCEKKQKEKADAGTNFVAVDPKGKG